MLEAGAIRYAQYYLSIVQNNPSADQLEAHYESILKAMHNCRQIARAWDLLIVLADALQEFMEKRGHWARWTEMLEIISIAAQQFGDEERQAQILTRRGRIERLRGNRVLAVDLLTQASDLLSDSQPTYVLADALAERADAYSDRSNWTEALEDAAQAVDIAEVLQADLIQARALETIGIVHYRQGRFDAALENITTSLEIFRKLNSQHHLTAVLEHCGRIYEALGKYDLAVIQYEEAYAIAHQIGDIRAMAASHNGLGIMALQTDRLSEAKEHFSKGLELNKLRQHNVQGMAALHTNLGIVTREMGDTTRSKFHHQQGLELATKIEDYLHITKNLAHLGTVAKSEGDLDQAKNYYVQSLEYATQYGYKHSAVMARGNLGNLAMETEDYDDALEYYQQILKDFQEMGDKRHIAATLGNIANVYVEKKQYDLAQEHYYQVILLARQLNIPSFVNIVVFELAKVRMQQAAQWLKVLTQHPATNPSTLHDIQEFLDDFVTQIQIAESDDLISETDMTNTYEAMIDAIQTELAQLYSDEGGQ